jgi:hypothetical protein
MKTGRNAPCPCGSGKKYKHCCNVTSRVGSSALQELLSSQEFDSIDELKAAADTLLEMQNQQPQDDLLGLSPEQAHRMFYFAFDTPALFKFSEPLSIEPEAPILMLIKMIVAAIDDKGLLATKAKGNLPQKLCREAWHDYRKLFPDEIYFSFNKVNKEDDFFDLHVARIVLELAGFIRKTKGRFYLTKKYQKIVKKLGFKGLYPIIFKTYCSEFNWGYWDRYSDVPLIQDSFLFTLFMLTRYGDKMTFTSVYEDIFLRAFPMLLEEMEETNYSSPEEDLRRCYSERAHKRFLVFLGLAELETIKGDYFGENKYKIKKTPLLDEVVQFNLNDSSLDNKINSSGYSDILQ